MYVVAKLSHSTNMWLGLNYYRVYIEFNAHITHVMYKYMYLYTYNNFIHGKLDIFKKSENIKKKLFF